MPAFFKTGGTELGHQLVCSLNNCGEDAKISYLGVKEGQNPLNPAFKIYVKDWIKYEEIPDEVQSVVIFPEYAVNMIPNYRFAISAIWWMSVDNYDNFTSLMNYLRSFCQKQKIGSVLYHGMEGIFSGKFYRMRKNAKKVDFHLYQSEYAKMFLSKKCFMPAYPLSDYISDDYLNQSPELEKKENIVVYNPKKGKEFTDKLISKSEGITWRPIENMTNDQVRDLLCRSKVYVDFGEHPGKDRIPREAVLCGCCIITGKKGAAGNDVDVPIPAKYKYDDNVDRIPAIIEKIRECMTNYQTCTIDFSAYREKIRAEKAIFDRDVKALISHLDSMQTENQQ